MDEKLIPHVNTINNQEEITAPENPKSHIRPYEPKPEQEYDEDGFPISSTFISDSMLDKKVLPESD